MSLYIHPENQELLWKIVNKNPLIQSYFSSYPSNIQETWFKQTISSFYDQNRANVATSEQLYEINKNTLSYMIQDVKRNVEFMENNRAQQPRTPQPTPTFSADSLRTTAGGSRLQASLADPNGLSMENRRFAPPGGSAKHPDLLKPYSVTENKEDRFTDQYNQYQQNYQSMFDKKVPENIDFREQFSDQPLSGNMEDLVQRHLRERDEELKKYAPAPFFGQRSEASQLLSSKVALLPENFGQGLKSPTTNLVDPILRSDNLTGSSEGVAPPIGFSKPSNYAVEPPFPTNFTSKLKIDSAPNLSDLRSESRSSTKLVVGGYAPLPENIQIMVEELAPVKKSSSESTVKWLDNENSDKIQSLEQEIVMLKGQVLQLSDKISFLINTNKDIFDFSAQRLKMTNVKISGGFLFDPQYPNLL